MEIRFIEFPEREKIIFLHILGYDINEDKLIVSRKTRESYICPKTGERVHLENAAILPHNSCIIINASALSISEYLSEFEK